MALCVWYVNDPEYITRSRVYAIDAVLTLAVRVSRMPQYRVAREESDAPLEQSWTRRYPGLQ
jgi:hypothetical protein